MDGSGVGLLRHLVPHWLWRGAAAARSTLRETRRQLAATGTGSRAALYGRLADIGRAVGEPPALEHDAIVDAPAEAVWDLIGRRFADVGEWSSAFPRSRPIRATSTRVFPDAARAPVWGRLCSTTIPAAPWITELLTTYDDSSRTLRYEAQGLPGFVALSRNSWSVSPIDVEHSRLALRVELETRGVLGGAARRLMLVGVRTIFRQFVDDLQHYLVYRTASPTKRRAIP